MLREKEKCEAKKRVVGNADEVAQVKGDGPMENI